MSENTTGPKPHVEDNNRIQERMDRIKHKVLVLSGKGGVGKSTVAVNLAFALAGSGNNVGLLDIDIHGPSIPKLLGIESGHPLIQKDNAIVPVDLGTIKVMSIGFLLQKSDDAVIWRGPMKYNIIKQFLQDVAWGDLDYLIVDSPPGTGDEPLSVAQLIPDSDGAVIVTTPQDLAIADVRKCISFCNSLKIPVLGVIENMSGFVCPACGEHVDIFKSGGGESMAKDMSVPFLGRIPIDPEIVEASDSGKPYLSSSEETETSKAFLETIGPILKLKDQA